MPGLGRARAARSAGAPRPRPRPRTSGRPRSRAAWARSTGSGSRCRCRGRPRGSSGPRGPRPAGRRPRSGSPGVDCGRWGACVVSRRSASESARRGGRGAGESGRSSVRRPQCAGAGGHARSGCRRRRGSVLRTMCCVELGPEVSHHAGERKGRQALVVAQALATMSAARSASRLGVGRPRLAARDPRRRSRPAGACRSGRGSSCRRPRRRRSGSAAGQVDDAGVARRRRRPSPSRRARRPPRSASNAYGVSRRVGRQDPARRPADEDRLERRPGRARRRPGRGSSRSGVPERHLGDAGRRPRRGRWTRIVPGRVGAADRPERWPRPLAQDPGGTAPASGRCGPRSARPNRPRSAGYGGRCSGWPRLPSRALSRTVSSPSM